MDLSISMQSLKNVFRFPFYDPRWKGKFLIGSALSFASMIIPILPGLPVLGYAARLMRSGARNDDPAVLPEWDDWGELFVDGLRQLGVLIIGLLPPSLIMFVGWLLYMGAIIAMPGLEQQNSGAGGLFIFGSMGIFFLSLAVSTALFLAAAVVLPAAMAHVAVTRSFASLFRLGEWWGILRRNFLGFQVAIGVFGVLYLLMMIVLQVLYFTLVLCFLIPFLLMPLGFYSGVVYYRINGQAYGEMAQRDAAQPAEKSAFPAGEPGEAVI
jgi:hypothetical protein